MKKKLIIITLITLFIISFPSNVKAIDLYANGGAYTNTSGLMFYRYGQENGGAMSYADEIKWFEVGGNKAPAYCMDPNLRLGRRTLYTCSPVRDAGLEWLLNKFASQSIVNNKQEYTSAELAIRFYGIITNFGTDSSLENVIGGYTLMGSLRGKKEPLVRYHQISVGYGEPMAEGCVQHIGKKCTLDKHAYFSGNVGLIDTAYQIATQAAEVKKSATSSVGGSGGGINFTLQSGGSPSGMTYALSSGSEFPQVKFKCENCTIVSESWSGKSGSITIVPPADCGEFKILVYMQPTGAQVCIAKGKTANTYQMLVTAFEEEGANASFDTNGEPMQTFRAVGVGCEQECCTEAPIEAGKMFGAVYNCCYDNTHSEVKEYDLNDLFCKDSEMNVQHYFKKCDSDYYIDLDMTAQLNDYCKMYCTERVVVDVPSAITATSGRYFDLTKTPQGTTSPYVEGFKRCRTIIDYDSWHKKYKETVEAEIKAYNDFQQNQAYKLMYDDSIAASFSTTESITVTCTLQHRTASDSCTYTEECTNDLGEPDECEKEDSASATSKSGGTNPTKTFTLSYTRYPFTSLALYPRPWYQVQIDEKRENDSAHIHTGIFLENDKKHYETSHGDWSAWDIRSQITTINNYLNQWNNKDIDGTSVSESCDKCSCEAVSGNSYWTCSRNTAQAESRQENVPEVRNSYNSKAQSANSAYNAASDTAKDLEDKIDKCDYYFEKYEGADAEMNYDFDASFQGFQYSQQYLGDYGNLETDINTIIFSNSPGCQIEGPILGPDAEDGLVSPQYSDALHYSTGEETMEDFKNSKLEWEQMQTGFEKYRHNKYEADKKFVQDAKYHATCSWDEPSNIKYTLIPRGSVEQTTNNFTINERQYTIFLTTLTGTYDTQWLLSGLGSRSSDGTGKFDEYFAKNGEVCSVRQNATDDGLFHCGLRVDHEIIETGKCNPDGDGFTVVSQEECDPINGADPVLIFKIADPKNLFPSCPGGSCDYGYNWFEGNKGPETLSEIQNRGNRDETYASSNVSYSYTLKTKDLKAIKEYNSYREEDKRGGYSDFTLVCDCPEDVETCNEVGGTNTCKRSRSCVKCRSTFLTNLYNGNIQYNGSSHSVTPGIGNIESIRSSKPHWAG